MSKTKRVVDGELEITIAPDHIIATLSREDVVGKRAEAQTKVDHLLIDLAVAQAEIAERDDELVELDK